jgi:hypothetical protein
MINICKEYALSSRKDFNVVSVPSLSSKDI